MILTPTGWSVVVLGSWNPAILTPHGISRLVLKVKEDRPLEIYVPLDEVGFIRVKHEGMLVHSEQKRLSIEPDQRTQDGLERAMGLARNALESLPLTPVAAAGVNIKYVAKNPDDLLTRLPEHSVDTLLSDAKYTITRRSLHRTLKFKDGVLNLLLQVPEDGSVEISFNFELRSTEGKALLSWLSIGVSELVAEARKVLLDVIRVQPEEIGDGN